MTAMVSPVGAPVPASRTTSPFALTVAGTPWISSLPRTPDGSGTFLTQPVIRLGRLPENDLVLADSGISRRHALLRWTAWSADGYWTLEDVGSTAGTFVNGSRVNSPRLVVPGDVIRIGVAQLSLRPRIPAVHANVRQTVRARVPEAALAPHSVPIAPSRPAVATPPPFVPLAVAVPARQGARSPLRAVQRNPLATLTVTVLLVAVLVAAGWAARSAFAASAALSGTISGDHFDAADGRISLAGIPATLTCNGVSTTAGADGNYALALSPADQYDCTVSSPAYQAVHVSIANPDRRALHVDFGQPDPSAGCVSSSGTTRLSCPRLHFEPTSLHGTVTWKEWGVPANDTPVQCWSLADARANGGTPKQMLATTTDASGAYAYDGVAPGQYGCVAGADERLHTILVSPGVAATEALPICSNQCPPVSLQTALGYERSYPDLHPVVMHTYTAYLVFWLPSGQRFEPQGNDARYEQLMGQYFQDIGGTAFYNLVTQYWDYTGPSQNTARLGGTWVDTAAYPHAGSSDDPVWDTDIRAEVAHAIIARHWVIDDNSEVFVFTAAGIQECHSDSSAAAGRQCTMSDFAGYHGAFSPTDATSPAHKTRYAYIYDYSKPITDTSLVPSDSRSPTGDAVADLSLQVVSHEHFESVSDPVPGLGWDDPTTGDEIGDKCEAPSLTRGAVRPDGSTVTLQHGHGYVLQPMWSNAAGGCAFTTS